MRHAVPAAALAAVALAGCDSPAVRPPEGGVRSAAPVAATSPAPAPSASAGALGPAAAAHGVFIDLVAENCGPGKGEDDTVRPPDGALAGVEQLPTANRWKVTDGEGQFLLLDVRAGVVTGATEGGLAAELPDAYALGCDPEIFLPAE